MPSGGKITPIQPSLVARMTGAVRGMIRGASDGWFGPSQPLPPVAPEEVRGRAFDYPFAFNVGSTKPRGEQGENAVTFELLRALSDPTQGGLDLLRIAIEKRKNQMEAQRWSVRGRDGTDGGKKARDIELALRKPDLEHTFSRWQRMLIEDMLVIDAPTIYLSPSTKGYRIPQIMDGATLKRLLRLDGRTPLPPEPAFQQSLKGLPAVDYSLDELVYAPRNPRSFKVYGMSPVEQVVMIVNIAIRRQLTQLERFTAGSIPEAIANVPDSWNAQQIKDFQSWWDALFSGNTEEQRRLRFVPNGVGVTMLKADVLKDPFEDWLARVIAWCFDLSPQALVAHMNRATADTAKQAAAEEGLEPLKLWWKEDVMDDVLARAYNAPELEFAYVDEEITDPVDKADVFSIALGRGGGKPWMTQDEVRAKYGQEPLTPEQREELTLGPGEQPPQDDEQQKLAKARRSLRPRPAAGR